MGQIANIIPGIGNFFALAAFICLVAAYFYRHHPKGLQAFVLIALTSIGGGLLLTDANKGPAQPTGINFIDEAIAPPPPVSVPDPDPPAQLTNLQNGEACTVPSGGSKECRSGYCLPGPDRVPAGSGKFFCVAASKNCAWPGSSGRNYGATETYGGLRLTCANPNKDGRWKGGTYWAQFYQR